MELKLNIPGFNVAAKSIYSDEVLPENRVLVLRLTTRNILTIPPLELPSGYCTVTRKVPNYMFNNVVSQLDEVKKKSRLSFGKYINKIPFKKIIIVNDKVTTDEVLGPFDNLPELPKSSNSSLSISGKLLYKYNNSKSVSRYYSKGIDDPINKVRIG